MINADLSTTQKESLELSKLQAETAVVQAQLHKIEAETLAIKKPVYRRESFYVSLTPIIVAIAGLIFSWQSGWFDVQQKRLDATKQNLETQNIKLQGETNFLAAQKKELQAEKASLEDQKAKISKQFDEAKERYEQQARQLSANMAEIEKERGQLIKELKLERDKYEGEKKKIEADIAILKNSARLAPIAVHLGALNGDGDVSTHSSLQHGSAQALLGILQGNDTDLIEECIEAILQRIETERNAVILGTLCSIMYKIDPVDKWRNRLFTLAGMNPLSDALGKFYERTCPSLNDSDYYALVAHLAALPMSNEGLRSFSLFLRSTLQNRESFAATGFSDTKHYVTCVKTLRDGIFGNYSETAKLYSIEALMDLSPSAFWIIFAVIQNPEIGNIVIKKFALEGILDQIERMGPIMHRPACRLGRLWRVPTGLGWNKWSDWLKSDQVKDIARLWLEPDLAQLGRSPGKIRELADFGQRTGETPKRVYYSDDDLR